MTSAATTLAVQVGFVGHSWKAAALAEKGREGKGEDRDTAQGGPLLRLRRRGARGGGLERHGGGAESPLGDRGKQITKGLAEHVELWMRR